MVRPLRQSKLMFKDILPTGSNKYIKMSWENFYLIISNACKHASLYESLD